jgi:hypothetical protein
MTYSQGIAIAVLVLATAPGPRAQRPSQQPHGDHPAVHTVGTKVTLTACVERGQGPDTFILTKAADVPVHPATHGRVVYWLDDIKALRNHVGHQVRVTGTITDVEQEEMEVKLGSDNRGGWSVEIEGPGRDVRTTPQNAGVETPAAKVAPRDIKTTLVKMKVDEVAMAAATCQLK